MSPNAWGPPIWTLFHCLSEKVKEEHFNVIGPQIFNFIKQICHNLPCPDCTQHAIRFLSKINPSLLNTKQKMKNFLFFFHNSVNKRKNKLILAPNYLEKYTSLNLIVVVNHFLRAYNTRGNMKLLTDTFHRTRLTNNFKKWMINHLTYFNI